jgi:hypothetical protein
MDALAKAIVISLHFLDAVEDVLLDPDLAIKIMESIVDVLSHCSAEEKEALRRSVNALADASQPFRLPAQAAPLRRVAELGALGVATRARQ